MASPDNDPEPQAPSEVTPCLAGDSFLARHLLAWPGLAWQARAALNCLDSASHISQSVMSS